MDKWGKISETSLSENEDFYSHLNIEDITDADYAHTQKVSKDFQLKTLGQYYHLHV